MTRTRAIVVFSALFALRAFAEDTPTAPPAPTAPTPSPAGPTGKAPAKKTPPVAKTDGPGPGVSSGVIALDPETGQVRPATPEEINRLTAGRRPAAAADPVVVTLPDGTQMMRLDERFHHYSLVRLTPDGKVESACVHGPGEAEAFARAAASKPPKEEK